MSELTAQQFQLAVAAAIEGVENLYRQVDLLITKLRECLAEDPDPLKLIPGTLAKSGREDSKRVVVRYEYGALFEPGVDTDDVADDDEDEDNDGDDEDVDEPAASVSKNKGKSGYHEIVADQPLLAVRIGMFNPRKRASFVPEVQFAVVSSWTLGEATPRSNERFKLQAHMLRRVAHVLADRTGAPSRTRIRTRAAARSTMDAGKSKSRKLTCTLAAGVESIPLYSIDNAEAVESLAERIKSMWRTINGR